MLLNVCETCNYDLNWRISVNSANLNTTTTHCAATNNIKCTMQINVTILNEIIWEVQFSLPTSFVVLFRLNWLSVPYRRSAHGFAPSDDRQTAKLFIHSNSSFFTFQYMHYIYTYTSEYYYFHYDGVSIWRISSKYGRCSIWFGTIWSSIVVSVVDKCSTPNNDA